MSHLIEENIDRVYSIEGTEWHGLAIPVKEIDDTALDALSHEIIESPTYGNIDGKGNFREIPNFKTLFTDMRKSRPDLDSSLQIRPIHIPKTAYRTIDNRHVITCMKEAFKSLDVKITSAGTLEGTRKFFISVDIGGSEMIINKDKFKGYVNFITSHDGTLGMTAFDSIIRIVCMNTLIISRQAAGDVEFSIYHTKNSEIALKNLPELFKSILKGRAELAEVMKHLEDNKCSANDALAIAAGFFCMETHSEKLSTRAMNSAQGIATLFSHGVGNKGETLYDLANGVTEYYTSGKGTGKGQTSLADRTHRSTMGSAADHKEAFMVMLADEGRRNRALKLGKQALALAK
jgi:phage/plasmid-like protein (TIGR03299 family)